MRPPPDLLDRSPAEATRRLALAFLSQSEKACRRLEDAGDEEALHDFRVALRRLRSCLSAYREQLAGSVSRKTRRRLRAIAAATGAGRDSEVQIAWLEAQRRALPSRRRRGLDWLLARLVERRDDAYRGLREGLARDFHALEDTLHDRLAVYQTEVQLDRPRIETTFARVTAEISRRRIDELAQRLAAVHGHGDEAEAHLARIAAKRLRYLLEPVASAVPACRPVVERMRGLQDLLGELHDAHVLGGVLAEALDDSAAETARRLHEVALEQGTDPGALRSVTRRDPRGGLLALVRANRLREERLFGELEASWLEARAAGFLAEARAAAGELADHGEPTPERRFLLSGLPPEVEHAPAVEIEEGWISAAPVRDGLRHERDAEGERWFRLVELEEDTGPAATAIEEPTTRELFERLWPLTEGRRSRRRRFRLKDESGGWTIDQVDDSALFVALPDPATCRHLTSPPAWLAPWVEREVGDQPGPERGVLAS